MKRLEKKFGFSPASFFTTFRQVVSIIAAICVWEILFSCASNPPSVESVNVNAFDTLEHDSNVYVRIPVNVHSELTNNLMKSFIGSDVPEKYIKNITDSIDMIYLGVGSPSNKGRLQIACDGNISGATKIALSSMENWKKETKKVGATGMYTIYTEANSKLQLCVPGSNLIFLSKDLTPQLAFYDKEASSQESALILNDGEANSNASEWKASEVYNFVGNAETNNVRIYMKTPLAFVTNLLGVSLSTSIFQLNFLEADLKLLPSGKYSIDLDMEFKKDGLVAKAAAFLNVAFFLADSKVAVLDERNLRITGLQVSMAQLQRILALN